jgi:glucokinase
MGKPVLGIDVGGTKTAWGLIAEDGTLLDSGRFATPTDRDEFVTALRDLIASQPPVAGIGVGIAGIVSHHRDVVVSPYLPALSHLELAQELEQAGKHRIVVLDNDARCALLGERWLGRAREVTSTILLTLGTGVGGAVMQKGEVLPHPTDITRELGHLVADSSDLFESPSGKGTIETLLGGRNLERRFGEPIESIIEAAREGDEECKDILETVAGYFASCVQAIADTYSPKLMLIGGAGSRSLDAVLPRNASYDFPIERCQLGEDAGVFGAAWLALDRARAMKREAEEWGDDTELATAEKADDPAS